MTENLKIFSFRPGSIFEDIAEVAVPIPISVVNYKPQQNAWRVCVYCTTSFPDGKGIAVRGCLFTINGEAIPATIAFHTGRCLHESILASAPDDGHLNG